MVKMKLREELAPQPRGNKMYLPLACHSLSKKGK